MNGYDVNYDVIVCGGGTSGVAAAISAAKVGAKVLLVERSGVLGGQLTLSGPPGFAFARIFNPRNEQDVGGFLTEVYDRLYKSNHAQPHMRLPFRVKGAYSFSYVDIDWLIFTLFDMMEENGVTLLLDSLIVDTIKDGDTVKGIVVENADGRRELKGKVVIDCTGEAYVGIQAGCETEVTDRDIIQPHSISFTVDGVDWEEFMQYFRDHPDQFSYKQLLNPYTDNTKEKVYEAYSKCHNPLDIGEFMGLYELRDFALDNGDWHPYSGAGFFLMPKEDGHLQAHFQHSSQVDHCIPTDPWDVTRCNLECRKQNRIAWRFFKNYVPGFEHSYITKQSTELRFREGPRVMGDYKLCRDDVVECRQFADTIGKSSFRAGAYHVSTMDTLSVVSGHKDLGYPKDGGSYDIPYRCLVPKKIENLLIAGKPVSTDRPSYLRYVQQTMVTGQAAGVAAALCVKNGKTPRELEADVSELQKVLVDQGAILYETKP